MVDRDTRLRGSIVIPVQSIEKSVAEIERCAKDKRFVQVLMLVMGDMLLGKRAYWPIYATPNGWVCRSASTPAAIIITRPRRSAGVLSHRGHVAQAQAFQTQLTSLIVEGVFAGIRPEMVMLESGYRRRLSVAAA
jgi:predicted TIM-barrel fold metal-dependent hydrolase